MNNNNTPPESEDKYRSLFQNMAEVFFLCEIVRDENHRPVDVFYLEDNAAAERLVGASVKGRRLTEVYPEFEPEWLEILDGVARTGLACQFERLSPVTRRWHAFHVFAAHSGTDQVGILSNDISDRKRMQEALRDADRRKDEFLAMLAHELRNPLASIRNVAQILLMTEPDERTRKSIAGMLNRQVGHMARQVDDLLDVSRISQGKIELRKVPIDLAAALNHAAESMRPMFESKSQLFSVRLPMEPLQVFGDPVRLAQVIGNLLNNASKFTDRQGRITLSAETDQQQVVIRVADSGIGLAVADRDYIFDIFAQVDHSPGYNDGLGLGLALVKSLVEMHGGSVGVHSEGLGHGAEFIVRLPLAAATTVETSPVKVSEKPAVKRKRILVVDDNDDSAQSLAMLLRPLGHDVELAHDGVEAVAKAAALQADVILLDIGMPRLDGYEAARWIRAQGHKDLLLVAVTGWGHERDRKRSTEVGFDAHLVKPVDIAVLTTLIDRTAS